MFSNRVDGKENRSIVIYDRNTVIKSEIVCIKLRNTLKLFD